MNKHRYVNCKLASHDYYLAFQRYLPVLKLITKHQPCPCCGGTDRFRLFDDWRKTGGYICNQCGHGDGIDLLMKYYNLRFPDVLQMLSDCMYPIYPHEINNKPKQPNYQDVKRKMGNIQRYLDKGKPLNLTESNPPIKYFFNRGVGVLFQRMQLPDNLFHIADMEYAQENEISQSFNGLLAAVHDVDGNLVGAHRTYLSADGQKASVTSPKKLLPPIFPGAMNGAAVRLYPAENHLCIAEGIETALAVKCMRPNLPVWATLTAGGMKTLKLPAMVGKVDIFYDHDKSETGIKAARFLEDRLIKEGRLVQLFGPQKALGAGVYGDWLDYVNSWGK